MCLASWRVPGLWASSTAAGRLGRHLRWGPWVGWLPSPACGPWPWGWGLASLGPAPYVDAPFPVCGPVPWVALQVSMAIAPSGVCAAGM